jgi:Tfp pilus assembly protein PilZ
LNILRVRCRSAEEFRIFYNTGQPEGGIFCPTTKQLTPDAEVVVEIVCNALPNRVFIRGTVVSWRPALPRLRVRAGAMVKFATEEGAKRDFVLETIDGHRKPTPRRRHTRIPIGLPVKLHLASEPEPVDADLREISANGALVCAPVVPPLGSEVVLDLVPPGGVAPMAIAGRVIYHAGPGQSGLRFVFREGGGSRRLRELVRRFKIS